MGLNATVMGVMPPPVPTGGNPGSNMGLSSENELGRPPRIPYTLPNYEMAEMLRKCVEHKASDLHLAVGRPPVVRINGGLREMDGPILTPQECRRLIYGILNDLQKQKFEENKELDFSLAVSNMGRFRVNVHFQRGSIAAAFRTIDSHIRDFED